MKWIVWLPAYALVGVLVALIAVGVMLMFPFAVAQFSLDNDYRFNNRFLKRPRK